MKIKQGFNILLAVALLNILMIFSPVTLIEAADIPVATVINPSSGAPGQTLTGVVITGTGLTGPTAVSFGSGITINNITFISDTRITVNLAIDSTASPGLRDVTITTEKGASEPLTEGFSISSPGAAVISLDAPSNVEFGSGFYVTINISNADTLNAYSLRLHFNPEVIQLTDINGNPGSNSSISGGLVNGVTFPIGIWSYQPDPDVASGEVYLIGCLPGVTGVSGSGYLAKVHFMSKGPTGSQSYLSLSGIDLSNSKARESFPASPEQTTIKIGSNPANVAIVSLPVTAITCSGVTLNGQLTSLGSASTINLFFGYATSEFGPFTFTAGPVVNSATIPPLPLTFSINVSGLIPNMNYFCIIKAQYGTPTQSVFSNEVLFHVTGPASKLGFVTQPGRIVAGKSFVVQPKIAILDAFDYIITGDDGTLVTLSIGSNPPGGTLSGNITLQASGGYAAFEGLSIDQIGNEYTLSANSIPELTSATSNSFNVVDPNPVIINTSPLAFGEEGIPYLQNLGVSGGLAPYTWTVQTGVLPDGLQLSPEGIISGTPSAANDPQSVIFQVSDYFGSTASKELSINILPMPSITTSSPLTGGEVNAAYSENLTASGGLSPYTWSVYSGMIPDGLTLNSSGSLSGTPTEACEQREIVLRVTDRLGGNATKGFLITITPAPFITTDSQLPNGISGCFYSQVITVSGGTPPYIWSLQSGNIPSGLMLQSSGNLTGTPILSGYFTFTVGVTDSFIPAQTASKVLNVIIYENEATVKVAAALQEGSRPEAGWIVPLTVNFFVTGNNTPADVMKAAPDYSFYMTTVKQGNTAAAMATDLAPGVYDISVTSEHCLCNVKRNVTISVPFSTVDMGTLREGDADANHKVNIQDFGILAKTYGKAASSGGYEARADFDRSGTVNITDFGLLASNYGKYCPIEVP